MKLKDKVRYIARKVLTPIYRSVLTKEHSAIYSEAISRLPKELNFMLFYGNLLFHVRGDKQPFIDDIDLMLLDRSLDPNIINLFVQSGFHYNGYVATDSALLALKFTYKECPVDIHLCRREDDWYFHEAVHFRNELAEKKGDANVKYYKRSYEIKFTIDSLITITENLFYPNNASDILEIIYGVDWQIPKSHNFNDYSNYTFLQNEVIVDMSKKLPQI